MLYQMSHFVRLIYTSVKAIPSEFIQRHSNVLTTTNLPPVFSLPQDPVTLPRLSPRSHGHLHGGEWTVPRDGEWTVPRDGEWIPSTTLQAGSGTSREDPEL